MNRIGEYFVLIGVDQKALAAGLATAKKSVQAAASQMQAIAAKAKIGLLLGAGGFLLAARAAGSFEQGMNRVLALTNATESEFGALRNQAMKLGRTTMFSARQSADAMGYFALAGFKANKIIAAMPATLNLAAAGQLDVGTAANITSKIMAGMGLGTDELTHAVDVLAKAFTSANTDLIQLGEAMKYAGPVAKSVEYSLEETVGSIMALSNAGMAATQAGNIMKNSMIRLSGGVIEANKVLKKLGVVSVDASGKLRPMADIIDDLNAAMSGMGSAQKMSLMAKVFGLRAVTGAMEMLAIGGDQMRKFTGMLEDAGGTAKRVAETQMKGLYGQLVKLKSAAEGLAIALGNMLLPTLTKMAARLTKLTGGAAEANAKLASFLQTVKALAIALGAVVVGAKVLSIFAGMGTLFAAGASAPIVLGMAALATTVGLLATAWMEAVATGRPFNEVLWDQIKAVTGLKDAMDRLPKTPRNVPLGKEPELRASGPGTEEHAQTAWLALEEAKRLMVSAERAASNATWFAARSKAGTKWTDEDRQRFQALREGYGIPERAVSDEELKTIAVGAASRMVSAQEGLRSAKIAADDAARFLVQRKILGEKGLAAYAAGQEALPAPGLLEKLGGMIGAPAGRYARGFMGIGKAAMAGEPEPLEPGIAGNLLTALAQGMLKTAEIKGIGAAQAAGGIVKAVAGKALAPEPAPVDRASMTMRAEQFAQHIQSSLRPEGAAKRDLDRNRMLAKVQEHVGASVIELKRISRMTGGLLR